MLRRVMSRFSVEIFFVSQCRKIWQGNPSNLCFRKILAAKKFMDKRGGGAPKFPSKKFCLTVSKIFVVESFSITKNSGIEKCSGKERRGDSRFSVEIVLSHSAIKIRRGTLLCCVSENFR